MDGARVYKANIAYTKEPGRFELVEDGYIAAENGAVTGVYDALPGRFAGAPLIDLGGLVLIPAFTDLHLHAPQIPNTGIGYDLELLPWLERYTFPLENRFSDIAWAEKVYARLIRELWENGILHSAVMATRHMEATGLLMELFLRSGLYACVGKVNMDRNASGGLQENTDDSIRETEALIQKYTGASERVRYIISPRFVPCATPALMDALGKLAKRYGVSVQSHLAENRGEIEWVRRLHPEEKDYASIYDKYGLLGQTPTVMAHCVHNTDEELALLKRNGVYVAHCPQSNLNISSGIMPLKKYMRMGLNVGLGSDIGAGNTLNMFSQMASAIHSSKAYGMLHEGQAPVSCSEAFFLATKGGGGFFGKTGSFEPGYAFDALALDDSALNTEKRPLLERIEKLIYCGGSRNISMRFLGGEVVSRPV